MANMHTKKQRTAFLERCKGDAAETIMNKVRRYGTLIVHARNDGYEVSFYSLPTNTTYVGERKKTFRGALLDTLKLWQKNGAA